VAAARPEPAPAADPGPRLPPRGSVEVSFGAAGIVARANQAPRREVLEAIARETGLVTVTFAPGGDPNGTLTFESEGEPLEVVLARALPGVPFTLEPVSDEGRLRLSLVVGKSRAPAIAAAPPARQAPPRDMLDPRERGAAERQQSMRQLEDEALAKIGSSDPRDRAEGVEWADLTSVMGYEAVLERLANDPDGAVRAAAAESLSGADVGAVRPLLGALDDPDPRVVMAALESLEMLGDESIVPDISRLDRHPDPSVRARAQEAIGFLQ
jgi:hypothetical protein